MHTHSYAKMCDALLVCLSAKACLKRSRSSAKTSALVYRTVLIIAWCSRN